ncbi:MAG: 8-oxo-dGTP diphosphatase [Frankiaceae bacterium]|nr:8-oxo-dGTP diphosphatase [Frankiaceae bacterium]
MGRNEKRDPALDCAGAFVRDDTGRVLLILRANDPGRGRWSLPAGRIEEGETAAEAAVREVREETGLDVVVGDVLWHGVVGPFHVEDFAATVSGGVLRAGDDAADARWFTADEVPALHLSENLLAVLREVGIVP